LSVRKFSKAAAIYTLTSTLAKAINFLLVPFYTQFIPEAEMGRFSALAAFYGFALMAFQFGMPSAIIKFYTEADTTQRKQEFVATLFLFQTLTSLVLAALTALGAEFISEGFTASADYTSSVWLIAASLFVETLGFNLMWLIRCDEKLWTYSAISFLSLFLNIGFALWLVPQGNYVFHLFLAQFLAIAFTFVVSLAPNRNQFALVFQCEWIAKLVKFGLPLLGYGVLTFLLDTIDKPIVTRFISPEAGGIYFVAYRLGMVMSILNVSFRTALMPFYAKRVTSHTPKENAPLFTKLFALYTSGVLLVFLVIALFLSDVMQLVVFGKSIFPENYLAASRITPVVLLAYLVAAPTEFMKAAINKSGENKRLVLLSVVALMINLMLIAVCLVVPFPSQTMQLQAVAFATVAAYIWNLFYYKHITRHLDTTPYPLIKFYLLVLLASGAVVANDVLVFSLGLKVLVFLGVAGVIGLISVLPAVRKAA
jgi:O-antigen/teichoic acid export membrane protein